MRARACRYTRFAMTSPLMSGPAHALSQSGEDDSFNALGVLIVFDELPAYKRALRLLVRIGEQLGIDHGIRPLPWQFEVLESPPWRLLASDEAEHAAIVVVASSTIGPLPRAIREWLQMSCVVKRSSPALLVSILGEQGAPGAFASAETEFLRNLTAVAGWEFLSPEGDEKSLPRPGTELVGTVETR